MITSHLVLAALDRQDTLAIVLVVPEAGQPPVIVEASEAFYRLSGHTPADVSGLEVTTLAWPSALVPEWIALVDAVAGGTPLRGEVCCQTVSREPFWLGFGLTHTRDPMSGRMHPVLIARNITAERRARQDEASLQALLGSMVMKADAAVLLVRADGRVSMTNPAVRALTGFSASELTGKPVRELTHPDDRAGAETLRDRQLAGGSSYRLALRIVTKEGRVVPVRLSSVLIEHTALEKFRVVTLLTGEAAAEVVASPAVPAGAALAATGRVETLSLEAIQAACGEAWETISTRLLLVAEQVIKRRLKPGDVFARSAVSGFVIWFDEPDEQVAAARLAGIARELRIRLLSEFGENGLGDVTAVATAAARTGPAPPTADQLGEHDARLRGQQGAIRTEARALVSAMSVSPPVQVLRVVDRDGKPAGLTWTDLPRAARGRLDAALASLPSAGLAELGAAARPELLRLQLAVQGLARDVAEGRPGNWLLPVGCDALASTERRHALLEALRRVPAPLRARLQGLLAELPHDASDTKLRAWSDLLRPHLHSVGALAAAPDLVPRRAMQAPCNLLALDTEAGAAPDEEDAFSFAGTARTLGLPLLVRVAAASEVADWRELGATLFAVAGAAA